MEEIKSEADEKHEFENRGNTKFWSLRTIKILKAATLNISIEHSCAMVTLPIESLLEEIKHVVIENFKFEFRDESFFVAIFWIIRLSGF